jgi:hypothetical protein
MWAETARKLSYETKESFSLQYGDRSAMEHWFLGSTVLANGRLYSEKDMLQSLEDAGNGDVNALAFLVTPLKIVEEWQQGNDPSLMIQTINTRRAAVRRTALGGTYTLFPHRVYESEPESIRYHKTSVSLPNIDLEHLDEVAWKVFLLGSNDTIETNNDMIHKVVTLRDPLGEYLSLEAAQHNPAIHILRIKQREDRERIYAA